MKPRLYYRMGVWCCKSRVVMFGGDIVSIGHGYTPAQAYWDWWCMTEQPKGAA